MIFWAGKRKKDIPTWFWFLIVGFPIAILVKWFIWWFFCPSYERTASPEIDIYSDEPKKTPDIKDDFRKLKGIGPKTAQTLTKAGIISFKQLGLMDTELLVKKLTELGLPTTNAAFWQESALIAAAGDWDKLAKLQNK